MDTGLSEEVGGLQNVTTKVYPGQSFVAPQGEPSPRPALSTFALQPGKVTLKPFLPMSQMPIIYCVIESSLSTSPTWIP